MNKILSGLWLYQLLKAIPLPFATNISPFISSPATWSLALQKYMNSASAGVKLKLSLWRKCYFCDDSSKLSLANEGGGVNETLAAWLKKQPVSRCTERLWSASPSSKDDVLDLLLLNVVEGWHGWRARSLPMKCTGNTKGQAAQSSKLS